MVCTCGLHVAWFARVEGALAIIYVFAMARRNYDVAFKVKAIATAKGGSKKLVARQFKIDAKRVRDSGARQPVPAPRRRRVLIE